MNRRFDLLWWTYAFALSPLIVGSSIFFYWFYSRRWFAHDADIELAAFLSILVYIAFGVIVLILTGVAWHRDLSKWRRSIGPLGLLGLTWMAVDLYSTSYGSLMERVFVRIDARGSGITEMVLWSAHFEQGYRDDPDKHAFILSYTPVLEYDYDHRSSIGPAFTVDSVFLEVHTGGQTRTYALPELLKGECQSFTLQEIEKWGLVRDRDDSDKLEHFD